MRLKLRKITSVSVKNSSFISEVFQTEDSGALLHSRGKLHKQKCFSAGSLKGDHFLWSSYVLSAQNIHFNDWEKYLLHRLSISNKGYICSLSSPRKGAQTEVVFSVYTNGSPIFLEFVCVVFSKYSLQRLGKIPPS